MVAQDPPDFVFQMYVVWAIWYNPYVEELYVEPSSLYTRSKANAKGADLSASVGTYYGAG
jgi:hypothetical protein